MSCFSRFREEVSSVDTIPVPKKPFSFFDDDRLKQRRGNHPGRSDNVVHHGRHRPQRDVPRIPPQIPSWLGKFGSGTMTEMVTALLVFLSVGIFLAHAFDAYHMR
jgi:hypothetical protein